ncbi:MAG: SpoIIE family protein phosphatase [Deltaproteobacteria bacterium]|nr:SpoIIE family protein phosphatase [Deltaproteobacteria bacterium]
MAWLVPLDVALQGKRFSLETPCLIGRGPLNHIVIDDPRISRQHAKISPEEGGHVLYDLNSANGTYVNGELVKRRRLVPNDIVQFGPFRFCFELADGAAAHDRSFGGRAEIRTVTGVEAPSQIIESLDAISVSKAPTLSGLSELEDADRKLRTLYAFMQSVSSTLDEATLVELIATDLLEVFARADAVTLYLRDEQAGDISPRLSLSREQGKVIPPALSVQVQSEVVSRGRSIVSCPFPPPPGHAETRMPGLTMHAPMIYRGVVEGVLEVHSDGRAARFTQRDLDLLTGLAMMAALALHGARMHVESLKQQRLAQDLVFAQEIQKSFLPRQLPVVPGLEFVTEYQPAYSVGGDFYDLFWLGDSHLGMFIGDVSGKGVSAALLMARIASDLRVALLAEIEPARALARSNRLLLDRAQHDMFVTAVCLFLDVRTGRGLLANAGHQPPLVRRGSRRRVEPIVGGVGTAIGFFEEERFSQVEFHLDPGDTLVLTTDGVQEASNPEGELFGVHRVQSSLASHQPTARDLCRGLLGDLAAHVRGAPQNDDITLIGCGRTG